MLSRSTYFVLCRAAGERSPLGGAVPPIRSTRGGTCPQRCPPVAMQASQPWPVVPSGGVPARTVAGPWCPAVPCPVGPNARGARPCWPHGRGVPAPPTHGPSCPAGCVPGRANRPWCPLAACPPVRSVGHTLPRSSTPPRPTTRATDAAGAASNLGATLYRCVVPPRFLPPTARSAADADVGRHLPYGCPRLTSLHPVSAASRAAPRARSHASRNPLCR